MVELALDGASCTAADRLPCLPGYELLEVLGRGGLGVVYLARQECLERLVAVKVIRPEFLADAAAVRRFRREARALARLTHPHIVAVHDAGHAAGLHYLALEHVPGTDLGRLVVAHGPLAISLACACVHQAALGLAHAHAHGLVHRDVKPSNLLVSGGVVSGGVVSGGDDANFADHSRLIPHHSPLTTHLHIKVADFGLARLPRTQTSDQSSHAGGFLGTPDYAAPEQIEAPGQADARADLYGLGGTLYYLLTGQVPFPGGTWVQKLDRQRWAEPTAVRALRPDVPAALAALVHRLLAKRPEDRLRSAAQLAAALAPLAGSATAPGGPPPTVDDAAATVIQEGAATTAPTRRLLGHSGSVTHLTFVGPRLASAAEDQAVRLWDLERDAAAHHWRTRLDSILTLTTTAAGQPLVLGRRGALLELRDAHTSKLQAMWRCPAAAAQAAALSADGRFVLTGGADQYLRLWEVKVPRPRRRLGGVVVERHWGPIGAVALSADGRHALSGSSDRSARLWDLDTGRELCAWRDHPTTVSGVAFVPDGRRALTLSGSGLYLWDLERGALLQRLEDHPGPLGALGLAANGRRAACGSDAGTVHVYDLDDGRELLRSTGHLGPVHALAFAPAGDLLASAGSDRGIRLWKLATEAQRH